MANRSVTEKTADDRTLLPDGALKPSIVVKNLSVYVDEQMTMDSNARQCVKTSFYHMTCIRQIRPFVNVDILHMLVHALILSCLDYCNSLYAGCTSSTACPGLCSQTTV